MEITQAASPAVLAHMCVRRIFRNLETFERNIPPDHIPIDSLDISMRTYNVCKNLGIEYLSQVSHMPRAQLVGARGCGRKAMMELDQACAAHGLPAPGLAHSFRDDLLAVLEILRGY